MVQQVKAFAAKLDILDPVGPTQWKETPAGYP